MEDVDPALNGSLCIQLPSFAWYNTSLTYLSGDLFGLNFTIPISDSFLGDIDVYLQAQDSDGGYLLTALLTTITVENNIPTISNIISNHTANMYRNDTISISAIVADVEDLPPTDLTAFAAFNLSTGVWQNVSMIHVGGGLFELNWTIPNLDLYDGLIFIYVMGNDTDQGVRLILNDTITVIGRPTNLTGYLNGTASLVTQILVDEVVNISVYYEETQGNNPLADATVLITCLTNPPLAQNTPMDNAGMGNYSWTFDPTSGGLFEFLVNATRSGFQSQLIQFNVTVRGNTNFTIYMNDVEDTDNLYILYFDETVKITTKYFNETDQQGIVNAKLNVTVLLNNSYYQMVEIGDGNYTWTFDASIWYQIAGTLPRNFLIKINASAPGFEYFEEFVTIRIIAKPTAFSVYLNDTLTTSTTIYYNEMLNITAYYNDTTLNAGIPGASVNITLGPMDEDLINQGNYTYGYTWTQLGSFQYLINATRFGYNYSEILITINVIARPTVLRVFVDDVETSSTSVYYNESVEIKAEYYDGVQNVGITSARVNITQIITYNMTGVALEPGNYSINYNLSAIGVLNFNIDASKYGYAFNTTSLSVTVLQRPTSILPYANGTLTYNYSLYLNQTVNFDFSYYDIRRTSGISNALVNVTNQSTTWPITEFPIGSGNYTFVFNATAVGNYSLIINASRYGYEFNSTTLYITVLRRPVNLTVSLNAILGNEITIKVGASVKIELVFKDNLTGQGIPGVLVNITWNPTYAGYTDGNGTFTFIFNATATGDYLLQIRVEKDGFVILQQNVTIHVTEAEPPGGDNTWMFIVVGAVAGAAVAVFAVIRSRRKKEVKPSPPKEPEKKERRPTLTDLLKIKMTAILHRPSGKVLVQKEIQPEKINKQEKAEFFKALPTLKDSKLENRIVFEEIIQILYHDGEMTRIAYLIEDRPSDDFFKANIEFTERFERDFEPELKKLPDDLSVFEGGITKELQNTILNFQLLGLHKIRKDQRFIATLPNLQKKIVRRAITLAKETGNFQLMNLVEDCVQNLKIDLLRALEEIDALWQLTIFVPDITIDAEERKRVEGELQKVEERIQKDQLERLTEQINEANIAALEQMKDEKYIDAAIYYEVAAQAAQELGNTEDYEKYLVKAEECINLKLTMIKNQEEKEKPKKKQKKAEPKKEEPKEKEISDGGVKQKIAQIFEETNAAYMSIVDMAQMIGISVVRAGDLAKKSGYKVTEKRIYQKGAKKAKEEDADEELKEYLNILMTETEKDVLLTEVAKRLGISEAKVRQLAEQEGYQIAKNRIKKKQ